MNRYPAKPMMDQMAQHGRYGDTMLVHMNPIEVSGLASLSPNGKLTTNPVTGQPEAFLPLLFGGLGSLLKLSPLMTGVLSGVGTAAVTGDIKRGLLAGVTSGLTAGAGDLIEAGSSAAEGIASVVPDAALDAAQAVPDAAEAVNEGIQLIDASANATMASGPQVISDFTVGPDGGSIPKAFGDVTAGNVSGTTASPGMLDQIRSNVPDVLKQQPQFMDTAIDKLGVSGNLVGAMTAEGMSQQMQAEQDFGRQQAAMREKSEAKRRQAYDDLQGAYALAQPNAQRGYSPYRSMMSRNTPPPMYSAQGGVVRMNEGGVVPTDEEARVLALAGQGILGSEDQMVLEGFYNNLNAANTAASQAAAEVETTENTLFIPEGATNQQALQALNSAGLVPSDAYNWMMRLYQESGTGDSQYFASESFPGADEFLAQSDFTNENKAYLRQVLPLIQQGATTGIPLQGAEGSGSVSDIVAYSPFGRYSGGNNLGYQGLTGEEVQANLRGREAVNAPRDFMTGFEPEFSYFQEDASRPIIPNRSYRPTSQRLDSTGEYFDPIINRADYLEQIKEYYSTLGNYAPSAVEYPTTSDPVDDDPNTTDGGDNNIGTPTPTFTEADVNALYQKYLGRDAQQAGMDYWLNWLNAGNSLEDLEYNILNSPEYLALQGGGSEPEGGSTTTPEATPQYTEADVNALYQQYLGRDAQQAGLDYWLNSLNTGTSMEDVIYNIMQSPEYKALQAGPAPTQGGTLDAVSPVEEALYKYRTMTPEAFAATGLAVPTVDGVSVSDIGAPSYPDGQAYQGPTTVPSGPVLDGTSMTQPDYQAGQQGDTVGGIGNTAGMGEDINWSPPKTKALAVGDVFETPAGDYEAVDNGYGQIGLVPIGDAVRSGGDIIYNTAAGGHHFGVNPNTGEAWYQEAQGTIPAAGFSNGGSIPLRSSLGNTEVAAGGIANVPTEFSASMPTEQEFNMVAAAVLGRVDDPDAIVDMFVKRYGPEMFQQIRNMVLRSSQPQAQTEGMIRGNGSGMDDKVPGMIGDQQPVAVSPGEFIVPADVVSGLGDGSSDAGAKELDQMMERVRMARGGTTKQAPSIDANRVMPA